MVPACCSEVSVVTAPFLSEGPSRSLSGTPPGRHPPPGLGSPAIGWLLSDLSVGSLQWWLMRAAGMGGGGDRPGEEKPETAE